MFLVPDFKGFDFFPHGTRINFMKVKAVFLLASLFITLASLACVAVLGLNFGVDFKGGSMIEVRHSTGASDLDDLRSRLGKLGLGDIQIQEIGTADTLIRVEIQPGGEQAQQAARQTVLDELGDTYELRRSEVVGPAVSSELRTTGTLAVLASLVAISAYVWARFEWQFALGSILALAHDVIVTVGLFSLLQLSFDLSIVAALLTILGYSVNDSVVVADRVRENLRKYKRMPLNELLNLSINETLSRTVLTGVTTVAVLLALYLFGGDVLANFSFAMLFGVLIGTYSSIFIGAPILGYLGIRRDWGSAAGTPSGTAVPQERQSSNVG